MALKKFQDEISSYSFRLSCSIIRDDIRQTNVKEWISDINDAREMASNSRVRLLLSRQRIGLRPFLELINFYDLSNEKNIITDKLRELMTPNILNSLNIFILMDGKYKELYTHAIFGGVFHDTITF